MASGLLIVTATEEYKIIKPKEFNRVPSKPFIKSDSCHSHQRPPHGTQLCLVQKLSRVVVVGELNGLWRCVDWM